MGNEAVFSLRHYAGLVSVRVSSLPWPFSSPHRALTPRRPLYRQVEYDAASFLEKNRDRLAVDVISMLRDRCVWHSVGCGEGSRVFLIPPCPPPPPFPPFSLSKRQLVAGQAVWRLKLTEASRPQARWQWRRTCGRHRVGQDAEGVHEARAREPGKDEEVYRRLHL